MKSFSLPFSFSHQQCLLSNDDAVSLGIVMWTLHRDVVYLGKFEEDKVCLLKAILVKKRQLKHYQISTFKKTIFKYPNRNISMVLLVAL